MSSPSKNGHRNGTEFHLFYRPSDESQPPRTTAQNPETGPLCSLVVPDGRSWLPLDAAEPAIVFEEPDSEQRLTFELSSRDGQPLLFLLRPRQSGLRWNGGPMPPLALLQVGDEIQLDDGTTLYVSQFQRPTRARPAPEHLGQTCPVCTVPFETDTRIWVCPYCYSATHWESDEKADDERLECVLLSSDCAVCHQPRLQEPGFLYLPEGV